MTPTIDALSLSEYNRRISALFSSAHQLQNVWVTAETADVRLNRGHCYLDLIEKDPSTGQPIAKASAAIWASNFYRLSAKFMQATGAQFRSDIKVMVLVSANYHPVFGLKLTILDINASYTLGDLMQRRNQMLQRLSEEGIINMNRELPWPAVVQRIAIISAAGAAGYGDFIHQLYSNPSRLRFTTRLFTAALQGERTAPTIIAALEEIATELENFDCVVIIRGGGASTDLLAFEDYDLAANIAQFPLPVIIGIGHERDITLLDYVANMRVKTPTAAAEWLICRGENALTHLQQVATDIQRCVSQRLSTCHQHLASVAAQLPAAARAIIIRDKNRLSQAHLAINAVVDRRIRPEAVRLKSIQASIAQAVKVSMARSAQKLDSDEKLIAALSPQATLRRGYSITRCKGHAVKSATSLKPGDVIVTTLADGTTTSKIIEQ